MNEHKARFNFKPAKTGTTLIRPKGRSLRATYARSNEARFLLVVPRPRHDKETIMTSTSTARHRVVIIGSGFGGLFAAKSLAHAPDTIDAILISRTNHHLFQPLLYQVATGILSEGQIAPPIRDVLRHQRNARVVLGEVTDVNVKDRRLTIDTLGEATTLPYDSLIVATGASQSYFGHDEYARHAPGMKSIDDALELRGRIFGAFEIAELEPGDAARQPWL